MLDAAHGIRLHPAPQDTGRALDFAPTPSGSRHGPAWFVVSSYPQAERRAAQHLTQQGYRNYLPLRLVRRRDRVLRTMFHTVSAPLFPSYLFVNLDPYRDPWRPILNTPGVYDLLRRRDTGMPDPCDRGAVEALEAVGDAGRCQAAETVQWAPGAIVAVAKGIFAGMPGVVLSADSDTAQVGIMFLGQLRTVSLPAEYLTARDDV